MRQRRSVRRSSSRPTAGWLQLGVPLAAWPILLLAIVPFSILKRMLDNAPGGGLAIFAATLVALTVAAGWAALGPDRAPPDGRMGAIADLRLAFGTRLAIHLVFLVALLALGISAREPVLLVVAAALLAAELPLAWLVRERRRLSTAPRAERASLPTLNA